MTTGTNLDAQLGVKEESTHGVPVVVNRFYPFNSETVGADRTEVRSEAIRAGRLTMDTEQRKLGHQVVAGTVDTDLFQEGMALLFKFALGSITSTSNGGSAPYTHVATLAGKLPSFTLQKGVAHTSNGGGVTAFTYAGCKIPKFTFSGQVGQPAKFKFDVSGGVVETTGTALASATFANNASVPFIFTEGSATVDGATVKVESFELNGDNHLKTDRLYAGSQITEEQLREARFSASGKLTVEFVDTTQYDKWRTGDDVDIVLAFSDGTNSATVAAHTYLKGTTPMVSGPGITKHDLTFDDVYGDSDTNAITTTVVNSGSLTP
jgi:hypothetical protein